VNTRVKALFKPSFCAVQIDWAGYTIGYYGRIFEARNKAKGGSFEVRLKGFDIWRWNECLARLLRWLLTLSLDHFLP
jgi:hypothetical protein